MRITEMMAEIIEHALQRYSLTHKTSVYMRYDIFSRADSRKYSFSVNWSCFGESTIEEARAYARELEKAADIAEYLSSLELELDEELESTITNKEQYYEMVKKLTAAFDDRNGTEVEELIQSDTAKEEPEYVAQIYCGRTYVGNGFFKTPEECYEFAVEDGFADRVKIHNLTDGTVTTRKVEGR